MQPLFSNVFRRLTHFLDEAFVLCILPSWLIQNADIVDHPVIHIIAYGIQIHVTV
jgi:hypothetical protein